MTKVCLSFWRILAIGVLALLPVPGQCQAVLLVVDSGLDRVLTVSPFDGSVINPNFIVNPGGNTFSTPKGIAYDTTTSRILLSDQITDTVYAFTNTGSYLGPLVGPAQGLDNIRGIAVTNNHLFVTVGGNAGGLNNTIQRFNLDGTGQITWASGSSFNSPFDIAIRANDVLVSMSSGANDIQRYDLNGNFLGTFHSGSISFAQQIHQQSNGNLLVAGFSPTTGIYEYDSNGNQINFFAVNTGIRGVYRLGNGNILWTGGTRLGVYDVGSGTSSDILNATGLSFQYIAFADLSAAVPEPASLGTAAGALAMAGLVWRRLRRRRRRSRKSNVDQEKPAVAFA